MASNNRDPFPGEDLGDDSTIIQRAIAVGKTVTDLVKESKRPGETSAHSRLTSRIDLQVSIINALESRLRDSGDQNADLSKRLEAANKQVADLGESLKASQHRAANAEAITNEIQAIINNTTELVSAIAEPVEKLKRDAAARLAEAETHIQKCMEIQDKTESLIRWLYRDHERHVELLGLGRKHTGSVAHKLLLLLDELEKKTSLPDKPALAHCLQEMLEELAEYRNKCDGFLDNGLADNNEPDRGHVPNDEGGALLNESYGESSRVASANNTDEHTNQARAAPVSLSGEDIANKQASREESSLFIDDQHRDEDNQSCTIKSEDGDNNQQSLADLPPSTKRASGSGGRAGQGAKRQRTK